jgi:isoleucyl-tRNA synthetase
MSTVLRCEPPFKTILGYATLFGEDGRPMHKSWGNAIEFNEAAERMGVDVMRWMYAKQRPEENILFGYGTADAARRELLVLWNVYAFFVGYSRLAGWAPQRGVDAAAPQSWPALDRWILSRSAGLAAEAGRELADFDAMSASRAISTFIDDLSTWYLRRSRDRMRVRAPREEQEVAFATLHAALVTLARTMAPILPFLSESMYQNLITTAVPQLPDSIHLTAWPADVMAAHRDEGLERAMATVRRAVEIARALRSQAGINLRQPIRTVWLALPPGEYGDELLELMADELNTKSVDLIAEGSSLVERKIKPLLPVIGPRLGAKVRDVMDAARSGAYEINADGTVTLAGVTLAANEVEIQAKAREGTAVAEDDGLVVVIDTDIDDELRAEGDAREVSRAVQDLRKQAELELDDVIELWIGGAPGVVERLRPHFDRISADTLAATVNARDLPGGMSAAVVKLSDGEVTIALRRREDAS